MTRKTSPKILAAVERVRAGEKPLAVCKALDIDVPMTLYAALRRFGVTWERTPFSELYKPEAQRARASNAQRRRHAREAVRQQGLPLTVANVDREMEALYGP